MEDSSPPGLWVECSPKEASQVGLTQPQQSPTVRPQQPFH